MAVRQDLARRGDRAPGGCARPGCDGDGAGHPLGRHRQHGARDPRDLRAARPRSARLHADGVRRRRAAACRAAGQGARDRPRPGAAQSRHPVRHGPAADRPARRLRRPRGCARSRLRHCPTIADAFRDLARAGRAWFEQEGIAPAARRITRTVDMRYEGQNYELPVPLPEGAIGAASSTRWPRASPPRISAVRLRRRGRAGAARHLPRRGGRRGAARRSFQPHPDAGPDASARDRRTARRVAAGSRRLRVLSGLRPRQAAARQPLRRVPRSSSRWTPRRWCRPA